jgi:hypothetical protein
MAFAWLLAGFVCALAPLGVNAADARNNVAAKAAAQPKANASDNAKAKSGGSDDAGTKPDTKAQAFDGVWRITRPCDGSSEHFDRCRNNDAFLVTTQLALYRVDDIVCGEVDQILSPLRSAGGFVWGKIYGDVAHVYFSNSGWAQAADAPGEAMLRMRGNKLDWRVTREAAGKWSVDSASGLAPLARKRYALDVWCPSQLGAEINNGLIEQGVQVTWKRYPKIPKRAPR